MAEYLFYILKELWSEVIIPEAVYKEVVIEGEGKPGVDVIENACKDWIKVVSVNNMNEVEAIQAVLDEGFNKRLSDIIRIRAYNRAHQTANKAVRTNEKDMDRTLRLILATAALEGIILSRKVIARQLKNILSAIFANRINTIATTETSYAAEQTKFDEVTSMQEMNIILPDGRRMNDVDVYKQWVARFINTRPWHAEAHGQIRRFNEPYIVKEERLMFPMDTSLGASLDNVINCYCSSHIFEEGK